jgi:hypothetical protein
MRTRPSDLFAVNGEYRRFCFDRAVTTFGLALEAELDSITGKNEKSIERKRAMVLNKWLDRPQQYRTPQATKKTAGPTSGAEDTMDTMVIPGDGSGGLHV